MSDLTDRLRLHNDIDNDEGRLEEFTRPLVDAMLDVIDLAGCPLNDVRMKRALAQFREVAS